MLKLMTKQADDTARFADPGDIVQAREAAAWSRDELADVLGVLPVEIAAWESGAIRLTPYEADVLRWRMASARHEAQPQPALAPGCDWLSTRRPDVERHLGSEGRAGAWAQRLLAAHRRECDACRAMPAVPAPEAPVAPGIRGWLQRGRRFVSRWSVLRVPAKTVVASLWAGAAWVVLSQLTTYQAFPDLTPGIILTVMAVTGWSVLSLRLLRPLGDRHPYVAGQIGAATLVVPGMLALCYAMEVRPDPGMWVLAALAIGVGGLVVGTMYDPDGVLKDEAAAGDRLPGNPRS